MGKVHIFGDNIDTDLIMPGQFLSLSSEEELARYCMYGLDPDFASKVEEGDVIVAGHNFGCGSSREHAPISIRALGISCVIAKSFARIFYRNAINIGLIVLISEEAADDIVIGDDISVHMSEGIIKNETTGKEYTFSPFPDEVMDIIAAGGVINKMKAEHQN